MDILYLSAKEIPILNKFKAAFWVMVMPICNPATHSLVYVHRFVETNNSIRILECVYSTLLMHLPHSFISLLLLAFLSSPDKNIYRKLTYYAYVESLVFKEILFKLNSLINSDLAYHFLIVDFTLYFQITVYL